MKLSTIISICEQAQTKERSLALTDEAKKARAEYYKRRASTITAEARAAQNARRRAWAKANPDKIKAQQRRYWEKVADAQTGKAQQTRKVRHGFEQIGMDEAEDS